MGIFYAKVSVANLAGGDAHETQALVDTGATDSAFPATLLEEFGHPAQTEVHLRYR